MPPSLPLPELSRFHNKDSAGTLTAETTELAPGLFLNADPSLELSGQWRSPPGRLLELQVETTGRGAWMALHVALPVSGLPRHHLSGLCLPHRRYLTLDDPPLPAFRAGRR